MGQMEKINDIVSLPKFPRISFSVDPIGPDYSQEVGGVGYPYDHQQDEVSRTSDDRYISNYTLSGVPISYTAYVNPPGSFIVEYEWDFGDGSINYGPSVIHTYELYLSQSTVTLTVTFTNGKQVSIGQTVILDASHRAIASRNAASDSYPIS